MNEEKRIAHAIILAQDMHFQKKYKSIIKCFEIACQKMILTPNLWKVLCFANHWNNDLRDWADTILREV